MILIGLALLLVGSLLVAAIVYLCEQASPPEGEIRPGRYAVRRVHPQLVADVVEVWPDGRESVILCDEDEAVAREVCRELDGGGRAA